MWTDRDLFSASRRVALVVHPDRRVQDRLRQHFAQQRPDLDVVAVRTLHAALDQAAWRHVAVVAAAPRLPDGTSAQLFKILWMSRQERIDETQGPARKAA